MGMSGEVFRQGASEGFGDGRMDKGGIQGNSWFRFFLSVAALLLLAAGAFLLLAEKWGFSVWAHLDMDELLYHLKAPLTGTGDGLIERFVSNCVAPAAGYAFLGGALLFGFRNSRRYGWLVALEAAAGAACLALGVSFAFERLDLGNYISNQLADSPFIEDNYVDPKGVEITFPEKKRNLVYIYLESMEMTFADRASGGAFEVNVIPELTELSLEGENFSGREGLLNGAYVMPGCTFTMGGMFAATSGLPLKLGVGGQFMGEFGDNVFNDMDSQEEFFPSVRTLGDILSDEGYHQVLFIGSNATFGGRRLYFTEHGGYDMEDFVYAADMGWIPRTYRFGTWGYEDEKLFEFARKRLLSLAKEDGPFQFTMLTVDTHFEDGQVCRLCREDFPDQYSNVMACSSRQVSDFVRWIQSQPFYENTTVIIAGDHTTMDSNYCDNVEEDYGRRVYTAILNSAADNGGSDSGSAGTEGGRVYTTLDFFPTTLSAVGAKIEGERLGLGTNLFSSRPTLAEEYGVEGLSEQLSKRSVFMEKLSAFDQYSPEFMERTGASSLLFLKPYNAEENSIYMEVVGITNLNEDVEEVLVEAVPSGKAGETDKAGKAGKTGEADKAGKTGKAGEADKAGKAGKTGEADKAGFITCSLDRLENGNYNGTVRFGDVDAHGCVVNIYAQVSSGMRYLLHSLGPDPTLYNIEDYLDYVGRIIQDGHHTVFLSVRDDSSSAMTEEISQKLRALGLTADLAGSPRHSYAAVLDGDVVREEISEDIVELKGVLGDGKVYIAASSGYEVGDMSSIAIDGVEYSVNKRGLNFCVYDEEEGRVVDSVCFDTNFGLYVSRERNTSGKD